jgi:hypothetical protein
MSKNYKTMKINFFMLTIIMAVILSGCKKNENSQQTITPPTNSYIKSISVSDTSGVLRMIQTLKYDALHRLIKLTELELGTNPDSILLTFTFDYSPIRVFMKQTISTSSNSSSTITYFLNSSGLADSSIYVSFASPIDSTFRRYAFTYNADNQILTQGEKYGDSLFGTIISHYSNLNVDNITAVPSNQKELFFYSSDHYNTIGNGNSGVLFLGKSCSNPLVKAKIDGMSVDMANYAYEYDQLNRISKMVVNGNSITPGVNFYSVPIIIGHQVMVYTYY